MIFIIDEIFPRMFMFCSADEQIKRIYASSSLRLE